MLREVIMRIAEIERRMDNMIRPGPVTDVDTKKKRARIAIGMKDGDIVKSEWIPYGQLAGDYKSHRPPTVGQQMMMFAPNGEHRQALLMPDTWSDQNQSPSDKPDEHVTTYGKLKVTEKDGYHRIENDQCAIELSGGSINLKAATIVLDGDVHLGGAGGEPASKKGTLDTSGDSDVANLATRVFVT